jgi:hypothetical protein
MKKIVIVLVLTIAVLTSCTRKVYIDEDGDIVTSRRRIYSDSGNIYSIEVIENHEYLRGFYSSSAMITHNANCPNEAHK